MIHLLPASDELFIGALRDNFVLSFSNHSRLGHRARTHKTPKVHRDGVVCEQSTVQNNRA